MKSRFQAKQQFYKNMIGLAIPIAIQTLLISSLNMVDSLMVGQLGVDSIAAVGVGNKITTILILVLQGFGTGAAIFSAQFWGKKDLKGIRKILYLTSVIMTVFSLLFSVIIFIFTSSFIRIFTNDTNVIELGVRYLRIISFSYFITALTMLFSTILKSMGEVKRPLYIAIMAICLNTLLNYFLIFGHLGFPQLGIEGAAIATVIARSVQTFMLFIIIKQYLHLSFQTMEWKEAIDIPLMRRYFMVTIPSIINHALWTVGETTYFWVYAQMGTEQLAAVTLIDPLLFVFMALFIGLSDASTVMVGNCIGANDEYKAMDYAKQFLWITFGLSIISAMAVFAFSPVYISIYNVSDIDTTEAKSILIIYTFLLTGKMLNMVNNIGVLRAGGDTKYVLYLDVIGVWAVGLPLALLGAFVWELPIYLVFGLANSHEFVRAFFGIKRTVSRKWINNIIESEIRQKSSETPVPIV
ncbi:MATE family efflux transporter [Metabacillus halosaccharovorans]|uniref:MATE family efflux transporter n=1 Tax=Metabacillus halosaccharovorans TaxID=930124 RepID=A0ABT3DP78_9BACI|nr:MATE family efflux transporter [Metabacillus halosaccharovorans]MCV9888698.1 MATE family efflux transporter [Metabacillus halosaccharovorans]